MVRDRRATDAAGCPEVVDPLGPVEAAGRLVVVGRVDIGDGVPVAAPDRPEDLVPRAVPVALAVARGEVPAAAVATAVVDRRFAEAALRKEHWLALGEVA